MSDVSEAPKSAKSGRKSGAATIYDIARLAGVNPSTVSRALNKPGRVSAATEARIRKAAAELNFHENPLARALPTGRTNTIAAVVADMTNPVVFNTVRGAENAAARYGFTLIVAESQESGSIEAATADRVAPFVDGIILATTRLPDEHILRLAERKPVVMINRAAGNLVNIAPDVAPGIDQLVEHLASLGHRSIAYLGGPDRSWISARRWEALFKAARLRGISVFEIGPNSPTIAAGKLSFERAQASGASAIVAYNDLLALGLIRAAREQGVSVPDDISVAGFDDIFGADFVSPSLTTVRADLLEAGTRAVESLMGDIGVDVIARPEASLSTTLMVRESTAHMRR
ncbi:LacI family DNA-binding transcriptional regulator [Demequina globuliformis]|uniref:LacI family DNA-binding transcriptional regulator n=1 Tax=Demequina globuliformis TaxID=676202 RepID=UPI000785DA16|nr:LacI family DNA-binding transcriptional regulator [Demequina globuliformis]